NMAKQIPGKEEFYETIRYFNKQLELHHVTVKLNTRVQAEDLIKGDFEEVILATGIKPRTPNIEGIDHPKVLNYIDVLKLKMPVGKRVAVIGAGGIGFDVSEYLAHEGESTSLHIDAWLKEWGIDKTMKARSGIEGVTVEVHPSPREIFMFKRSKGKFGGKLGKTTGWIHRSTLKKKKVQFINQVQYTKIDDEGLHYVQDSVQKVLAVDTIIICAGQLPCKELLAPLEAQGIKVHVVGGADIAAELDAKRAINQASRLAAII
ncbi:MAG: FAD-dependent oxidoreductase, partial [Maribacter sp.]|uniref:FAD-dependent oxidoreductase n=1 Tax=Maribacter sp. TaxID=1897614 RepID=UPI003C73F313